jgi:hypothetical protein
MQLPCNTYQVLVLLNAGCYNFEALRVKSDAAHRATLRAN